MGIMDDEDTMMDILEYLEERKIDIHFENNAYLGIFRKLEQGFKIKKQMKGRIEENKKLVEKTLLFKPKVNDDFILEYRTDDEEEQKELREKLETFNIDLQNFQEDLQKKIREEMLEKSPTIDSNLIEYLRNNS